jgi:hypothetical protein
MHRRTLRVVLAIAVGLSLSLVSTAAVAGPNPVPKATGSIGMTAPMQYVSFNAFDYGTTGDRGHIRYANFEYFAAGTGVWNILGTYQITFSRYGDYPHTMIVDAITPLSPRSTMFTGYGFFTPDPTNTDFYFTVQGIVVGSDIWFDFQYAYDGAPLTHVAGDIAPDGSMSGSADDGDITPMSWVTPPGSVHEVLSYEADVNCAVVAGTDASFVFQIPTGFPGLSGLYVLATVHDGGSPGTAGDTWGHGVVLGPTSCTGAVGNYVITSGNLVVH